jgi:hypothetical protein
MERGASSGKLQGTAVSKLPCFFQGAAASQLPILYNRRSGDRRSLLFDLLSYLTFINNVFTAAQLRLFGITSDIVNAICEVLFVANKAIKIIPLPKTAGTSEQ